MPRSISKRGAPWRFESVLIIPNLKRENMHFSFFVGIDISKKSLDFAVRDQKHHLFHCKVNNSLEGLNQFKAECLIKKIDLRVSLICCEHTGIYSGAAPASIF